MRQDTTFLDHEGNQWFNRNRIAIDQKVDQFDLPTYLIDLIQSQTEIDSIAELGCSNGWRLKKLQERFPNALLSGVDASLAAIEDGQKKYPNLDLYQGLLADIPLQKTYDIVIVHFVLCWVDRAALAISIAEIDRLVKQGGMLIIGDFYPDFPQRRHYHHLPEQDIFTYKQNYPAIFESFGTYQEIAKFTGNHDVEKDWTIQVCDSSNRFACSILHKSLVSYYQEL